MTAIPRRLPAAAILVLLLVVPGGDLAAAELPQPDLSTLHPVAREKIETVRSGIAQMLGDEAGPQVPLDGAFAFLGQLYHASGLLEAAEGAYSEAVDRAPSEMRWRHLRGLVRHARGDLAGAVEDFRAAGGGASGATAVAPLLRLGNAQLDLGQRAEAAATFRRALALDANAAAAHDGLGRAADDPAEAVRHLERALELQPEADSLHYALAQAYRRQGDAAAAERHLALRGEREVAFTDELAAVVSQIEKSIALEVLVAMAAAEEGFDEEPFIGFATAHFGGSPQAVQAIEGVLQGLDADAGGATRRQSARLHAAAGRLLAAMRRDADAIRHLERAVELEASLVVARASLADALAREGRWEDASRQFTALVEHRGDDAELLAKRAEVFARLERWDEARRDLEKAVALQPAEPAGYLRLAAVLAGSGDLQAAHAALESGVAATGGAARAELEIERGELYRHQGDAEAAATAFDRAIAIAPELPAGYLARGGLAAGVGDYGAAAVAYEALLARQPGHGRARVAAATARIYAGEHGKARDLLEEGLALSPDDLGFKDLLARHLAVSPDRSVRDGARAVQLARELFEALPTVESVETLAMAHAEAGDFAAAVEWQERLVATPEEEADEPTRQRWQRLLERYRRGETCCDGGESGG